MDHTLTRAESLRLMELLSLPMEQYGNFPLMRKAFLQKCKILHPDKGGNQELAKELISLYKRLEELLPTLNPEEGFSTTQIPQYGTPEWDEWWNQFNQGFDLFCDENFANSDDEPDFSHSQKRSAEEESEGSQATPPKKKKEAPTPQEVPDLLKDFISHAIFSNKTFNCFLVYTTLEKSAMLYNKISDKFKASFISRHKLESEGLLFCITPKKHRVSALSNFCHSFCSISFLIVKAVIKEFPCYDAMCLPPFQVLQQSIPTGLNMNFFDDAEDAVKAVSWKLISEFALEIMCDDVHLLLGLYKEFASPVDVCKKCDEKILPDHFKFHWAHKQNAELFLDCKNQKTICQQAVDGVIAKRRVDTAQLSRKEQLTQRFKMLFQKLDILFGARGKVSLTTFMAGVAWFDCLFPNMKDLVSDFLECMLNNIPKKRYWFFTGPVNTGKTTLAAALLDLCGGKSLNVNMPFDKINFELGVAIDQFMVVFEDVKGQTSENKTLPTGQGICNLDNLRDHLDGAVKVNLEKKHLNKKTQIFPPGIITANEYFVPLTLRVRFAKTLRFLFQKNLYLSLRKTPALGKHRVLQSGETLLLLLVYHCAVEDFCSEIQDLVVQWKQRIDEEVSCGVYLEMVRNVQGGLCIFGSDDSGIFTQQSSQTTQESQTQST
ncbi:large T antigen [Rhinolophus hildebrandtii polyomavirus 1]|uniref:large T antigen n=1 Tax=Rhinolophus hildebrandtii polyomavirus 1 TaxID=1904410 RepID=UPI0009A5316F|nr:large T antigen [Rhinolophus hildebrandtii polyomavirus 1]BAX01887.1 large T antigen [Rhinolophus hildebrandtii polyomavirus 1]